METWDCCGVDNRDEDGDYEQGVDDCCFVGSSYGCSGSDKGAVGTGGLGGGQARVHQ